MSNITNICFKCKHLFLLSEDDKIGHCMNYNMICRADEDCDYCPINRYEEGEPLVAVASE